MKSFESELMKAKKMPIGTVSNGRKKVAEGKWVPVKKDKQPKKDQPKGKDKQPKTEGQSEKQALMGKVAAMFTSLADKIRNKFNTEVQGGEAVDEVAGDVESAGKKGQAATQKKKFEGEANVNKRNDSTSKKKGGEASENSSKKDEQKGRSKQKKSNRTDKENPFKKVATKSIEDAGQNDSDVEKAKKKQAKEAKVAQVMREWKEGTLNTGQSKKKVPKTETGQKQAIAIAMDEAGMSKSELDSFIRLWDDEDQPMQLVDME